METGATYDRDEALGVGFKSKADGARLDGPIATLSNDCLLRILLIASPKAAWQVFPLVCKHWRDLSSQYQTRLDLRFDGEETELHSIKQQLVHHECKLAASLRHMTLICNRPNDDVLAPKAADFLAPVFNLPRLTTLNLSSCRLSALPPGIGHLPSLRVLDLDANRLQVLPEGLGQLTNLRVLRLRENGLCMLPDDCGGMTTLVELQLSHNYLRTLPECVGQLQSLRVLDLGCNHIAELPDSLAGATSLTSLNLAGNDLHVPPPALQGLAPHLCHLDLHDNALRALPSWLGEFTSLRTLRLQMNDLCSLPASLGDLPALSSLLAHKNRLTSLPDTLPRGLTELCVGSNALRALPRRLARRCASLAVLRVYGNDLRPGSLPRDLSHLAASLRVLDVAHNPALGALPAGLGRLASLTHLDARHCGLHALPAGVGGAAALKHLDVGGNRIAALPRSMRRLTDLCALDLRHNALTSLGVGDLATLPAPCAINLQGNALCPDALEAAFAGLPPDRELPIVAW